MNRFFLMGGFAGFILTFLASLSSSANLNLALRDGMIGCLVIGFGFKIIYQQIQGAALQVLRREAEAELNRDDEE